MLNDTLVNLSDLFGYRKNCCACALIDHKFIIGSYNKACKCTDSCMKFDTKTHKWTEVLRINEARAGHACTVYTSKIVVSNCGEYSSGASENYSII